MGLNLEMQPSVSKRFGNFEQTDQSTSKRQRYGDNVVVVPAYGIGSSRGHYNSGDGLRDVPRPESNGRTDDMDDDFFLSQAAEIQKMEELATQHRIKVREMHPLAPDFESRSAIQPRPRTLPPDDQIGMDRFLLADNIVEGLERANAERERCEREKGRLKEQLVQKNGEITILRDRLTILERERMRKQLESSQAAIGNKLEFEGAKKTYEDAMNRMKSEMNFLAKEKQELQEHWDNERKRREALENRLLNDPGLAPHPTIDESRSPTAMRNAHAVTSGPAFPDRRSFYGATATAQPNTAKKASLDEAPLQLDDQPNEAPTDYKRALVEFVNQGVQTDDKVVEKKEPVLTHVLARFRLGRLGLREVRPNVPTDTQPPVDENFRRERELSEILSAKLNL